MGPRQGVKGLSFVRFIRYITWRVWIGSYVRILRRSPRMYNVVFRIYRKINGSFRNLSSGAPEAIFQACNVAKELSAGKVGDYYEFGLFQGHTFWSAQLSCRELHITDTNFYGFDSFQGLPAVEGAEKYGQSQVHRFEGENACSKAQVIENLTKHGIDWSRTVLIEGFYNDSLTKDLKNMCPFKNVAVAFIDCELYSSTRDALSWLSDLLTEKSILLFDDWYEFGNNPELGQQKAFREFLNNNPQFHPEPFGEFHFVKGFMLRQSHCTEVDSEVDPIVKTTNPS